jgi:hypothetical protein
VTSSSLIQLAGVQSAVSQAARESERSWRGGPRGPRGMLKSPRSAAANPTPTQAPIVRSVLSGPGGHPNSPTDGHPKFPHPGAVAMTG